MIFRILNIKDHISEIISINNLQIPSHFIENTNVNTYITKPKVYQIGLLFSFLTGLVIGKIWLYFNDSYIGKIFINNVNIYILKYFSRKILDISLFGKLFIFLLCIFIVIDIYQNYYCNSVFVHNSFESNLGKILLNKVENKTNYVIDTSNSVIIVKNPIINVPVEATPTIFVRVVIAALSTAAGLKSGIKLAKIIPSIGGIASMVLGTIIASQTINDTANKILNYSLSYSISETKNSFISVDYSQFINENVNISKNNEIYSEYPYNLIPDLNMYINIEIWFLIILINVLLTAYLLEKKIDINKFIKNDRFRKILNYMYNRYISIWSVSRNFIIIWCILMLLLCIFMSKLILFILLSS